MKNIYHIFLSALILFLFVKNSNAQINTIICNGDSAVLKLSNYTEGSIQWEQSPDNIHWTNIPGATLDSIKVKPNTNKYFRTKIIMDSICYSETHHVLSAVAVAAYTGFDKDCSDTVLTLDANTPIEGYGAWSIISGNGGVIVQPTNPHSVFTGRQDSAYILRWTIINSCGMTYSDVKISFIRLTTYDNIIVVDTVNTLLSDSSQLSQGIYIIQNKGTLPAILISSIIVGTAKNGFLRKVTGLSLSGNDYTLQTDQATMEDIFKTGALNLVTNPQNNDSLKRRIAPSMVKTKISYLAKGVSKGKNDGFQFDFGDVELFSNDTLSLTIPDGYFKFNPNFVFDFVFDNKVKKLFFYADNALLETNINLALDVNLSTTLMEEEKELAAYSTYITFYVPIAPPLVLPVTFLIETKLKAAITTDVSASATVTTGITNTNYLTLGLKYENENWTSLDEHHSVNTIHPFDMSGQFSMTNKLELIPEVSVRLYGVAGPYFDIKPYTKLEAGISMPSLDWSAQVDLGLDATIGANVIIFGDTLADYSEDITGPSITLWQTPYMIQKISGDEQSGNVNTLLPVPVKVRILDNLGNPWPNVPVYFSPISGNSTVSTAKVTTDQNGFAEVNWTLGNNAGEQTMEVSVKKYDGSFPDDIPIIFTATVNDPCPTLHVTATVIGDTIIANATGGNPPYKFSIDGINFSTNNLFPELSDGTYNIFVKDATDCIKKSGSVTIGLVMGIPCPGMLTVTDIDGNVYNTVLIGTQCWMRENLKVGTMINGDSTQSNNGVIEKYCYNDNPANCNIYGGLYQWAEMVNYFNGATNSTSWNPLPSANVQGICPTGWHVPSNFEWLALITYLGDVDIAGGKLKETGTLHWKSPNTGATNSSGYTALPGGNRDGIGTFALIWNSGYWWSSTENYPYNAFGQFLYYNDNNVYMYGSWSKSDGKSIRCVKD